MDVFDCLSRFCRAAKEHATLARTLAGIQSQRVMRWLQPRPQVQTIASAGIVLLLLVVLWKWYSFEQTDHAGVIHHPHAEILNPIAAALGGAILAWAAFRQARTATRQAEIASERHKEQTDADRQRRLTEGYSRAVAQLASEKIEERVGGIYTLEQISQESQSRYWPVMETLTAFVRERSQRNERERTAISLQERISKRAYFLWEEKGRRQGSDFTQTAEALEKLGDPPATDITAALTVIRRRSEQSRDREISNKWILDLSGAILKRADLQGVHLEGANLVGAHLVGGNLSRAHLAKARLGEAHLEGSALVEAHLAGANLTGAHLEKANLRRAHLTGADFEAAHLQEAELQSADLEGANLTGAHLQGADLRRAHLEGADLVGAHLEGAFLRQAHLERVDFARARLEGAFLTHSHLNGALLLDTHFEGADFEGADLGGVDLLRAHLGGARLHEANLEGANLDQAFGLSEAQLAEAHGDANTYLPAGMGRPSHWPVPDWAKGNGHSPLVARVRI
jgi:uncharacterized protein YjbI with pentapeptide repeats